MSSEKKNPVIEQMAPWLGDEERRAVDEYLASGGWLTEFQKTAELEQQIATYTGASHAIMVNSGTSALFCAVVACGIGPGDEVLVPDFTMIASANVVGLAGAKPILVDVVPQDLCIDLAAAERALTPRTRALMYVSINGRAREIRKAVEFCTAHSLTLIEDAAQSMGSTHAGRHLGTFGRVGILSFSPLKIITTGQGGAVITNDDEIAARARRLKDFGRLSGGVDVHESIGYNFKFTDLQAVIGLEQMKKLDGRVKRKKEMFRLYEKELRGARSIEFLDTDLEETTPWFIDVLADRRDELMVHLKQRGIRTRAFYPPIHSQRAYGLPGKFSITEDVAARGLWLPSSSALTDEEIVRVAQSIRNFYCGM